MQAYETLALLDDLVEDKIVDHPSKSPDLNVMEDIWSHLDRAVKAVKIKTVAGLKRKLTMEWEKLKWSVIRNSVRTMPARLAECEQLEGERLITSGYENKIRVVAMCVW